MKIIKKWTALMLVKHTVDDVVNVTLSQGDFTGPFYSRESPDEEFDSEIEALQYANKKSPYATWVILPIVRFEN
jgi:hypothetical protein